MCDCTWDFHPERNSLSSSDLSSASVHSSSMFLGHGLKSYPQLMILQGIFHIYNVHNQYSLKNILILMGPPQLWMVYFPGSSAYNYCKYENFKAKVSFLPPISTLIHQVQKQFYCFCLPKSTVETIYSCLRDVNLK